MEYNAFNIVGISCDDAEAQCLLLSHRRQVGGVFHFLTESSPILFSLLSQCSAPPYVLQNSHVLPASLEGQPDLGRVLVVPNVLHFLMIVLTAPRDIQGL